MDIKNLIKSLMVLWCFHTIQARYEHATWLSVSNGGYMGTWGHVESCVDGTHAVGFSLKIHARQRQNDDTAVNGIRLFCSGRTSRRSGQTIESTSGPWGEWNSPVFCPRNQFLVSFKLQVQPEFESDDATAVNSIKFTCRDEIYVEYKTEIGRYNGRWGSYGYQSNECPVGQAICGLKTKVQRPQGDGDDTALNDVNFHCC